MVVGRGEKATSRLLRLAWRWLPLIVWLFLIFLVSDRPKAEIPDYGAWDLLVKKSSHFVAYGIVALLARRALHESPLATPLALLLTFLYAVGDEYHQTFVPGRHGNWIDVLIDTAGGVTALAAAWWLRRRDLRFPHRLWASRP